MVKRVVIGRSGEEKIVDLIKALDERATAGNTSPSGNKVLEYDEDIFWTHDDGREISVRQVEETLEDARGRIDDAEGALALTDERLTTAEGAVASVQSELDGIDWENLDGAEVYTNGPPPINPTIGKALWVSPTGRVFRAIECEEHA